MDDLKVQELAKEIAKLLADNKATLSEAQSIFASVWNYLNVELSYSAR